MKVKEQNIGIVGRVRIRIVWKGKPKWVIAPYK